MYIGLSISLYNWNTKWNTNDTRKDNLEILKCDIEHMFTMTIDRIHKVGGIHVAH